MEKWGAKMEQCNNKMNKLDEIHRNAYEIRTNFLRISYKLLCSHPGIHVKFVRISYEFHVNFVKFGNKLSKHTSKHTLQTHGHAIHHAPAFVHLRDRHGGVVFSRCHNVVSCTGGATPDMAKWIPDSTLTLHPLQISIWCTLPMKKSMLCSAISMTARSELGAERERKVGWRGQVGGAGRDRLGGVCKEGLGSTPLPQPHPPNHPLPHPQHVVHAEEVPAGKIASKGQGLLGGGGVQVRGVGLVVAVPGVTGPHIKKSPWQPILGVGEGRQPMVAAGGRHQQHVPPLQLNGVPASLPRLPQCWPPPQH